MHVVFRPYRKRDKKALCRIIAPTWRFDEYFPGIKNTERLCALVVDMFRMQSDYTDIAVLSAEDAGTEEPAGALSAEASADVLRDGEPAAFLFAETPQGKKRALGRPFYRAKKNAARAAFYIKVFFLWIAGFYGERGGVRKAFLSYHSVQKNILKGFSFDAELLCLFVDASCQGSGLGRRLLSRFFEWSSARNIRSFVLTTDTDCNYRFYDRCGFKRLKEQSGCLGIPQNTDTASRIFVYGISEPDGGGFSSGTSGRAGVRSSRIEAPPKEPTDVCRQRV